MYEDSARTYAIHTHGEDYVRLNERLDSVNDQAQSFNLKALAAARKKLNAIEERVNSGNCFFREGDIEVIRQRIERVEATIKTSEYYTTGNFDHLPMYLRALRLALIGVSKIPYVFHPKV